MTKGADFSAPLPEECFFLSFLSFTLVALYDISIHAPRQGGDKTVSFLYFAA